LLRQHQQQRLVVSAAVVIRRTNNAVYHVQLRRKATSYIFQILQQSQKTEYFTTADEIFGKFGVYQCKINSQSPHKVTDDSQSRILLTI